MKHPNMAFGPKRERSLAFLRTWGGRGAVAVVGGSVFTQVFISFSRRKVKKPRPATFCRRCKALLSVSDVILWVFLVLALPRFNRPSFLISLISLVSFTVFSPFSWCCCPFRSFYYFSASSSFIFEFLYILLIFFFSSPLFFTFPLRFSVFLWSPSSSPHPYPSFFVSPFLRLAGMLVPSFFCHHRLGHLLSSLTHMTAVTCSSLGNLKVK